MVGVDLVRATRHWLAHLAMMQAQWRRDDLEWRRQEVRRQELEAERRREEERRRREEDKQERGRMHKEFMLMMMAICKGKISPDAIPSSLAENRSAEY